MMEEGTMGWMDWMDEQDRQADRQTDKEQTN